MKINVKLLTLFVSITILFVACYSKFGDNLDSQNLNPILSMDDLIITNPNLLNYENTELTPILSSISVQNNTTSHKIESSIVIMKQNVDITIATELNYGDSAWKAKQKENILQKINEVKSKNLNLSQIQIVITEIESIFENSTNLASHEVLYGLSYNLSIFKSIERSLLNPNNSGCTVHPGFLVGKTFFGCQEDVIFNKSELNATLSQYESENGIDPNTQSLRNLLNNTISNNLTFKEVYNLYYPINDYNTRLNSLANSELPPQGGGCWMYGSTHGCCGNYKGCCYLSHMLCYFHDRMCTKCKPGWFCFKGCVPDPKLDINDLITDPFDKINPTTPETPVYNFPEDYIGLYYYVSSAELAHNDNTMYSTSIFKGASNKYYYNSGLTCLIPDGYYFTKGNSSYYKVVNGLVKEIGRKPTNFPGGMKPLQYVIDNLFPICN